MGSKKSGLKRQIPEFMSQLPTDKLLSLAITKDQIEHAERIRGHNYWIAQCWMSRVSGWDDPLVKLALPRKWKDFIWLQVDMRISMWELIQTSFSSIKETCQRYNVPFPFECAFDLFKAVVSFQANKQYTICLEPYKEISIKKLSNEAKFKAKLLKGVIDTGDFPERSKPEIRKINQYQRSLRGAIEENGWEAIAILCILVACKIAPDKNKYLKTKLLDFARAKERCTSFFITGSRRRGEWADIYDSSFAWNNGKKIPANSRGTYSKKPKHS